MTRQSKDVTEEPGDFKKEFFISLSSWTATSRNNDDTTVIETILLKKLLSGRLLESFNPFFQFSNSWCYILWHVNDLGLEGVELATHRTMRADDMQWDENIFYGKLKVSVCLPDCFYETIMSGRYEYNNR